MESELTTPVTEFKTTSSLHTVTPLSKYLAMMLFVLLPFVGAYVGYQFGVAKTLYKTASSAVHSVTPDREKQSTEVMALNYDALQQQYAAAFGVPIDFLYTTEQAPLSYFKTLTYSSLPSKIIRYDHRTNNFSETPLRINYIVSESDSPSGRYITQLTDFTSPRTSVLVHDLESDSVVQTITVGEGEVLWSGVCGYAGPTFDLTWINDTTLRYGVYDRASIDTAVDTETCDTTLIEYREVSL